MGSPAHYLAIAEYTLEMKSSSNAGDPERSHNQLRGCLNRAQVNDTQGVIKRNRAIASFQSDSTALG